MKNKLKTASAAAQSNINIEADDDEQQNIVANTSITAREEGFISFKSTDNTESPQMAIIIQRGINMPKMDIGGKCDAYVQVLYDGAVARTTSAYNTYSPVWEDDGAMIFALSKNPVLELQCFDSDMTQDEIFGYITVNLSNLLHEAHQLPIRSKEDGMLRYSDTDYCITGITDDILSGPGVTAKVEREVMAKKSKIVYDVIFFNVQSQSFFDVVTEVEDDTIPPPPPPAPPLETTTPVETNRDIQLPPPPPPPVVSTQQQQQQPVLLQQQPVLLQTPPPPQQTMPMPPRTLSAQPKPKLAAAAVSIKLPSPPKRKEAAVKVCEDDIRVLVPKSTKTCIPLEPLFSLFVDDCSMLLDNSLVEYAQKLGFSSITVVNNATNIDILSFIGTIKMKYNFLILFQKDLPHPESENVWVLSNTMNILTDDALSHCSPNNTIYIRNSSTTTANLNPLFNNKRGFIIYHPIEDYIVIYNHHSNCYRTIGFSYGIQSSSKNHTVFHPKTGYDGAIKKPLLLLGTKEGTYTNTGPSRYAKPVEIKISKNKIQTKAFVPPISINVFKKSST